MEIPGEDEPFLLTNLLLRSGIYLNLRRQKAILLLDRVSLCLRRRNHLLPCISRHLQCLATNSV
ncbi:MAG: hypothetical protein K0U98_00800 [Deltaproteobacteria bacterium]|nr:hypothetical protein [Deltaproteobacteria bacterium]